MLLGIARKIFGTANERFVKSLRPIVEQINLLEPQISSLSDEDLKKQTEKLRAKLLMGASLDNILPEAFATVREASKRVLGMRHFDVQLIGGIVLHKGMISEMRTGEGKTLVATLPCYLNAIQGKGVHVVTVNDYLAKRDSAWMGKIHEFLGLSVGCIVHGLSDSDRKAAYAADITYGTNNEFGFDYLRDNLKFHIEDMAQRKFNFAIVDEVDSILVDEARTPLIISGPSEDSSMLYQAVDSLVAKLDENDYEKDEKSRTVALNEAGTQKIEDLLREAGLIKAESSNLYDIENVALVHHVNQALKAHTLFSRDVDYIVKDNKVIIIDEFTGRMMEGRRYSEGLHQALEAKEKVRIQQENQTLASITFQNYFRLYPKLAGMTGTAMTEAGELREIYKLEVVEIPTNVGVKRIDGDDIVFRTAKEKYDAIIELIAECSKKGQPVLVGTVSIEKSELLSDILKKKKIAHNVLNARYHEQEANIIAQAGRKGAVTIATNMAGRGTDIMLGGNAEMRIEHEVPADLDEAKRAKAIEKIRSEVESEKKEVLEAGGLFVIGTERHESRRIDNQLRGRSGRQGDPGESRFFLSLEDDLLRIFGSERIDNLLVKLGIKEGEAIFHPWMNKALEKAQQKVEARNFEVRKNLLKFDNVMNDQRKVIYEQRIELMTANDVSETILSMRDEVNESLVKRHIPDKSYYDAWDLEGLDKEVFRIYKANLDLKTMASKEGTDDSDILKYLSEKSHEIMDAKEKIIGSDLMRSLEKRVLLQTLDQLWKDHLLMLDHLKQGINLRAYGQRDPLNEYKSEAFSLFENMLVSLREEVITRLAHIVIDTSEVTKEELEEMGFEVRPAEMIESRIDPAFSANIDESNQELDANKVTPIRKNKTTSAIDPNDPSTWGKVLRNALCPCGSGLKYKFCHGKA